MDVHFKQEARGRFKQDAFKGFTLTEASKIMVPGLGLNAEHFGRIRTAKAG